GRTGRGRTGRGGVVAELVLFVIFGSLALTGALTVVFARNPVYSALGLMLAMLSLAVFYVVHLAHFIAAVQVIVYAGAVVTLFLFVIMMIGVDSREEPAERLPFQRPLAGVLGAAFLAALLLAGRFSWITVPSQAPLSTAANGTIEAISEQLFTEWLLPFEVASLLLVIAAVAAVALAFFRFVPGEEE
ncbi:MAG: NADH-quinone oxidoreductase subunit J, partial [Actinomycetota bacterium]|nr:NADH-quinone oxidoreductase subunit J [Actinomycetota bacterium]